MKKRPDQLDAISWQRGALHISGFYYTNRRDFYFYFSCFVNLSISWLIMGSQVMRMVFDLPDMLKVLTTLQFSMTQFAFLAKATPFLLRLDTLLQMVEDLKNPLFSYRTLEQDRFIQDAIDNTRWFAKVFWSGCVFATIFMTFSPFIDDTDMPIPSWYPFDIVKYRNFIIGIQGVGFVLNVWSNTCIDLLMSGLISLMSAELEILKDKLMNITGTESSEEEKEADEEEVIYKRLVNCVQHHDAILDYVNRIEAMFSLGVLFQFFASILTICLTGVVLITMDFNSSKFVGLFIYFLCMIIQIALNCWFGHDIMSRSDDLIDACYMNNWYKTSPIIRQVLFMIMEKAKRPVKLTAGKVFVLNLTTFVAILRSSYSYFAVLNRLYGD